MIFSTFLPMHHLFIKDMCWQNLMVMQHIAITFFQSQRLLWLFFMRLVMQTYWRKVWKFVKLFSTQFFYDYTISVDNICIVLLFPHAVSVSSSLGGFSKCCEIFMLRPKRDVDWFWMSDWLKKNLIFGNFEIFVSQLVLQDAAECRLYVHQPRRPDCAQLTDLSHLAT